MDQQQLAVFKYKHGDRIGLSGKRLLALFASIAAALFLTSLLFPFGILAFGVPLIVLFGQRKTLSIGPRYLICGDQIMYYANVRQAKLSEAAGTLSLHSASGKVLVIERDKFPTNARKTHKIAANKAAKFNKVTAKILEKVRLAAPDTPTA